jgi:hypothetical protein
VDDWTTGVQATVRSDRAAELERVYGPRPWLALPTARPWPPDREDVATTV